MRLGEAASAEFEFNWLERRGKIIDTVFDRQVMHLETQPKGDASGFVCTIRLVPQTEPGILNQRIEFVTDDPSTPRWTTRLHAKILSRIELAESEIALGKIALGERKPTTLRLSSTTGRTLAIRRVRFAPENGAGLVGSLPTPANDLEVGLEFYGVPGRKLMQVDVVLTVDDGEREEDITAHLYALSAT